MSSHVTSHTLIISAFITGIDRPSFRQADCGDGEDEYSCKNSVGTYCHISKYTNNSHNGTSFIDKRHLCDNQAQCDTDTEGVAADERECDSLKQIAMECAKFGGSGEVVEIEQKQKCEFPNMTFLDGYCEGYIDQMNCTAEDVFVCTVRVGEGEEFLNTRLRRQWVCNNKVLCADGSDEWCHAISDTCQVSE